MRITARRNNFHSIENCVRPAPDRFRSASAYRVVFGAWGGEGDQAEHRKCTMCRNDL